MLLPELHLKLVLQMLSRKQRKSVVFVHKISVLIFYSGQLKRGDISDLEARAIGTELAGSLAGVASNVGLTDAIKKVT